jgi:hypothetical protein
MFQYTFGIIIIQASKYAHLYLETTRNQTCGESHFFKEKSSQSHDFDFFAIFPKSQSHAFDLTLLCDMPRKSAGNM